MQSSLPRVNEMQKVSQNNKEQSIWNCKAIFITEQLTAHVREVTFVNTWSLTFFFKSLFSWGTCYHQGNLMH